MGYLTIKQFSEKWGISERRIINLCRENRINGAIKNGMVWMIPEDTVKPADKRSKIVEYINTEKRISIINVNSEISKYLVPLLQKNGYIVEGFSNKKINEKLNTIKTNTIDYKNIQEMNKILSKYYEGLIFIDIDDVTENKEEIVNIFSDKMNCSSSIVLLNGLESSKQKLEEKICKDLKEKNGARINAINIQTKIENQTILNYDEIAEDVVNLIIGFKNTTGTVIDTTGGAIEFEKNERTRNLLTGEFYKTINNYFKNLTKDSHMWCASTMLEDEWTEEPLEMAFRVTNLEAANRGVKLERIFIFSKSKIQEFKNNKTLKIYMQSNINTMFVDYDEILEKEPELLKIVGDGWDGINQETLIVDLPTNSKERGYISRNKKEIKNAYECFKRLKTYAKDLKEILK